MILLDTHAWVWWLSEPALLSAAARGAIDAAADERRLLLSAISAWEVTLLAERRRLQLTSDVEAWIERSVALPFLTVVPVDVRIAVRSVRLPAPLHPDPADRIIAATALTMGASLVTRDERLRAWGAVSTIW